MDSVKIVLVEPETSENIGFVSRIMKNFGFNKLIIVNPKCNLDKAYVTAMHGRDILRNAEIVDEIPKFEFTIATSAKLGMKRNLRRIYIPSYEVGEYIRENTGILFGRESSGLTNKEIEKADVLVHIPTTNYKALNLSHAVGIILCEIFKSKNKIYTNYASRKEVEMMIKFLNGIANKVEAKPKTEQAIKNLIMRAKLREKEVSLLLGLFHKVYEEL